MWVNTISTFLERLKKTSSVRDQLSIFSQTDSWSENLDMVYTMFTSNMQREIFPRLRRWSHCLIAIKGQGHWIVVACDHLCRFAAERKTFHHSPLQRSDTVDNRTLSTTITGRRQLDSANCAYYTRILLLYAHINAANADNRI